MSAHIFRRCFTRTARSGALRAWAVWIFLTSAAIAQPAIVSPVPHGIVQISRSRDIGLLRIQAQSGKTLSERLIAIDYRFVDAYNRTLFSPYWSALRASNGVLDTTLNIPLLRQTFKLLYRIVAPDSIYIGEIQDLAIGHVIGVAGQSNAEGWSPPPYPDPIGDVRVLRNTKYWEYGSNPSGKRWNGPWVYMANKFRELVPDGLPIGIVNTAKGGTGLASTWTNAGTWKRQSSQPDDPNTVYGNAVRMFRAAGGNMEAICWIQGEADVVYTSLDEYREGYKELVKDLEGDLDRDLDFYHWQISGQVGNLGLWRPLGWGWIHEAQRDLYDSKLAGSAVAYPLSADGIHYERSTTEAVGHRFAAALARERYGVSSALYPPILADTAFFVPVDSDRVELGLKILLRCEQGDSTARWSPETPFFGFELANGETRFDTARVIAKAHTYLDGWIEVTLRDSVISDTAGGWSVSYAIRADVGRANVLDTSTASTHPNALVAFLDIPIGTGREPAKPQPTLSVEAMGRVEDCSYRWHDLLGSDAGWSGPPSIAAAHLPPGAYLYVRTCGEQITTGKWLILNQ